MSRSSILKTLGELFALIAILALVSGGCNSTNADVTVTKVQKKPIEETLMSSGILQAAEPCKIIPQVSGFVADVYARDGQQVNQGDVLLQMETDSLEQAVLSAKGSIESTQSMASMFSSLGSSTAEMATSVQNAMNVLTAGMQSLYDLERLIVPMLPEEQRLAALQQIESSRQNFANSNTDVEPVSQGGGTGGYNNGAQLAAARKGLEMAEENLKAATITAPVSGTLVVNTGGGMSMEGMMAMMMTSFGSMMPAGLSLSSLSSLSGMTSGFGVPGGGAPEPGSFIMPGTELFSIIDFSSMSVAVKIPETDIAKLKAGQRSTVVLEAYPAESFEGTVDYISPSATTNEAGSVAFECVIKLDPVASKDINLKLGMTGMVNIVIDTKEATVVVPIEAVLEKEGKTYVFLVEDNVADLTEVRLGLSTDETVELTSGVKAGDLVVTRGAEKLKDGQKL